MSDGKSTQDIRRLGDPYAFAFLQWPAVVGFMEAPDAGWGLALKIACGVWVALLSLGAILGRRGAGTKFGLAITLCAGLVAAFWATHPGPWMYLCLAALLIVFHTAQRARLDEPAPAPTDDGVAGPSE